LNTGSSGTVLYVTYCSREKNPGRHPPDKLYIDRTGRITKLIEYCRSRGLNWAILSAKYGFLFPDEEVESYDVTLKSCDRKGYLLGVRVIVDGKELPRDESNKHVEDLVNKLLQQARERKIGKIVFYTRSLKMPKAYIAVLHAAFNNCWENHKWNKLLEHLKESKTIEVRTKLE